MKKQSTTEEQKIICEKLFNLMISMDLEDIAIVFAMFPVEQATILQETMTTVIEGHKH